MITQATVQAQLSEMLGGAPCSVLMPEADQYMSVSTPTKHELIRLKRYDKDLSLDEFAARYLAPLVDSGG